MSFATDYLKQVKKEVKNDYATIVKDGIVGDLCGFLDTGSYMLNALVSGSIFKGLPDNKISLFSGTEGVGKSFVLMSTISNYLKQNSDGIVVFLESESAQRREFFEQFDIDTGRVFLLPVRTVQEFAHQSFKALQTYEKMIGKEKLDKPNLFLCLDSLGNLSTTKEVEDMGNAKEVADMTRSRAIKGAFRVLGMKMGLLNTPLICTNHTYLSMGSIYPTQVMSGGSGPKYNNSTSVFLSKRKETKERDHVGNIVRCKVEKSRFTKENSSGEFYIDFSTGLDRYYGLLDITVEMGIVKSTGKRFIFPNDEKQYFKKEINREPARFFTPLLNDIDTFLSKKFQYGNWNNANSLDIDDDDDDDDSDDTDEIINPFDE